MKRRLYYLLPDVRHARQATNELLLARIDERHIHVLARDNTDLEDLPEATMSEKSDFFHGMGLGLFVGSGTGAVLGLVLLWFPPSGLPVGLGAIPILAVFGAVFGIWVSGMIGMSMPNSQLKKFRHALARGKILMMVDVPRGKMAEVDRIMGKADLKAVNRGLEPEIPALP